MRVKARALHVTERKNKSNDVEMERAEKSGGVAQLGEHLPCKQGVRSSSLLISTNF